MEQARNHLGKIVRSVALALAFTMSGAWAWPACGLADTAPQDGAEADPSAAFGVEVTVAIKGRGRVVSDPTALDCPANCFARVVLADATVDGSAAGLGLLATASNGSRFVGWTYEAMDVGVRAHGPPQCSPMIRTTTVLPLPTPRNAKRIALHYGETAGTPPPGLEAECAEFTTVPVAYALTATFEEIDVKGSPPPPPGPPIEVLFEPPTLGEVVGKEIGVTGGRVYWRFDRLANDFGVTASGIASGQADGKGGGSIVNVQPSDVIARFDVDRHVVFQHVSGLVESIQSGSGVRTALMYRSPCASLASDNSTVYCRETQSSVSYLYSCQIGGGGLAYIYTLPRGSDLALDERQFYFSSVPNPPAPGQAIVGSASRFPDGGSGIPIVSDLVFGQTSPRDLIVGAEHLFWLDEQPGTTLVHATTAPKIGAEGGAGIARAVAGARFIAVDPTSPTTFYVGISSSAQRGASSIVKASALSSAITSFREDLTGIGGIAVDDTHVFWTQNDGRVYRAPKDK